MFPQPRIVSEDYRPAGKLRGKTAIITGGDSGIGQAVAVAFAKEGADVAILYLNEHADANKTKQMVEAESCRCLTVAGDIGDEMFCRRAVDRVIKSFGKLDILVNNAAEQHPKETLQEITQKQLERTFRTNIFAMFFMTKAAMKHLKKGATIINTASVTAYRGSPHLLDYSATKGAIVAFTRSLGESLAPKGIRVNGVAPGPIWTPLIPSTFPPDEVETFGAKTPMGRPGEPAEIAPSYVFLACEDSSYFAGQMLHPNGGEIINT